MNKKTSSLFFFVIIFFGFLFTKESFAQSWPYNGFAKSGTGIVPANGRNFVYFNHETGQINPDVAGSTVKLTMVSIQREGSTSVYKTTYELQNLTGTDIYTRWVHKSCAGPTVESVLNCYNAPYSPQSEVRNISIPRNSAVLNQIYRISIPLEYQWCGATQMDLAYWGFFNGTSWQVVAGGAYGYLSGYGVAYSANYINGQWVPISECQTHLACNASNVCVPVQGGGDDQCATDEDCLPPSPQTGSVSGIKYHDLNANGLVDAGEPGFFGWTIYVDYNNNSVKDTNEPSAITSTDGSYTINNVIAGTYSLREVIQDNWFASAPASGVFTNVTIPAGGSVGARDFLNYQKAQMKGFKSKADASSDLCEFWNFSNRLNGWVIYLYSKNNLAEPVAKATTTTVLDEPGVYQFTNILPGNYIVKEESRLGWSQTYPAEPPYHELTVTSGGSYFGDYNFCNKEPVSPPSCSNVTVIPDSGTFIGKKGFYNLKATAQSINLNLEKAKFVVTLPSGKNEEFICSAFSSATGSCILINNGSGQYSFELKNYLVTYSGNYVFNGYIWNGSSWVQ